MKISLSKVKALKIKLLQKISPNASILKPAQWNSNSILLGRNDPQNQNNISLQFKLRTLFTCGPTIGAGSIIGAGIVVVDDVPNKVITAGSLLFLCRRPCFKFSYQIGHPASSGLSQRQIKKPKKSLCALPPETRPYGPEAVSRAERALKFQMKM